MTRKPSPRLTGERVFLRHPTARDRGEHTALRRASREFLERWEPRPPRGVRPFTPAQFDRLLKGARSQTNRRFVVCLRDSGAIIGHVGLNGIFRGPFQSCFVGYWIGKPFARQGYMTDALGLVLRHAFEDLGLHRVEANIVPTNKASKALAKRCGFRFEGTAKRYLQIAGRWRDHEHWAMTAEDWRKVKSRFRPRVTRGSGSSPARSPAST